MHILLLKSPDTYSALTQEIRSLNAEDLSFPRLENLPFLHAVIEESFRMYPPVPIGLPRLVPDGGATLSGHFVPARVSQRCLWLFYSCCLAHSVV